MTLLTGIRISLGRNNWFKIRMIGSSLCGEILFRSKWTFLMRHCFFKHEQAVHVCSAIIELFNEHFLLFFFRLNHSTKSTETCTPFSFCLIRMKFRYEIKIWLAYFIGIQTLELIDKYLMLSFANKQRSTGAFVVLDDIRCFTFPVHFFSVQGSSSINDGISVYDVLLVDWIWTSTILF